ncbi:uncharacterized protein DC041_0003679 [Schistosoma bovis]|nr:uncharacterized protein DC041_0003679 [Schistosoma bovis]
MPSMSISSRVGSRKTSITGPEQGSFDRPINKTQPSLRNNPSSNNSIHSSGSSVSSNNIKTNQTSNSTKSLPKSSASSTVQQRPVPSRISLPSGTSGSTTTIRKPTVPSFGSSRGKSSGR